MSEFSSSAMPPSESTSIIRATEATQVSGSGNPHDQAVASSEPVPEPSSVELSGAQSVMSSGEASTAQEPPVEGSASGIKVDEPITNITTAAPPLREEPPTQAATTTCRYWAEGYCFRGALCWYRHSRDPASASSAAPTTADALGEAAAAAQGDSSRPKSPISPTTRSLNAQASAFSPSTATSAADQGSEQIVPLVQDGPRSDDQRPGQLKGVSAHVASDMSALGQQAGPSALPEQPACMICYEMPATYGLLDSCSHSFCLSCIRQWRKGEDPQAPNVLSGVNKRCPMCRGSCLFITPASIFYTEGPAKSLVIQKYKENLSRKPCNFFEATKNSFSGPFCKFGDDCHYAHVLTPGDDRYLFGGGFEVMSARARERRERREAQRMRRPFHSGPLGLTEAEEAELDYLRFFDVMISNGNDPADWDRDTSPPRPATRRYSEVGAGLRFPHFEVESGQPDLPRRNPSRRARGDGEESAGRSQGASRSRSPGPREGSRRIRAPANASGLQVRSAEAARGTFSSSTRSDRRAAQRRYRREALEAQAQAHARAQARAQSGASGSSGAARESSAPSAAAAGAGSSPDQPHDEHSPGDSFELVGEEDAEGDPPSPSGQLFNLARAFEEGYERGGRWEVEDEDEHNEHSHDSRDGMGADDDDDESGWSTDEDEFQYRVGPGGSIWLHGEEIFAGEYGSIWDDENDGHIWYYE